MDPLKEAFQKIKQDINFLRQEIIFLKKNLEDATQRMIEMCDILKEMSRKEKKEAITPKIPLPTHKQKKPTLPTHPSTNQHIFKALKEENLGISTGNQGVPTDRQTDRQTNQQTEKPLKKEPNSLNNALEILGSLDDLKKEIRLKFKRLTEQEMLVFSLLYQLTEEQEVSDYKTLSQKLNLTESSIRDYIGRLIKKGIPVEKTKINNKNIQLSIPLNFRKIASLSTILQLREI